MRIISLVVLRHQRKPIYTYIYIKDAVCGFEKKYIYFFTSYQLVLDFELQDISFDVVCEANFKIGKEDLDEI